MNMKIKHIGYVAVLAAALPLSASAYFVQSEGNGGGHSGYGPYQTGQGGEFTFYTDLSVASYVSGVTADIPATGVTGPLHTPNFESFCISATGNFNPGVKYNATPVPGNANDKGQKLSAGVAWLYSQFASVGNFGGFATYSYGAGRTTSAGELQDAIWALTGGGIEGQVYDPSNPFDVAAKDEFGTWSAADASVASGTDGVSILLLTDANGAAVQSQLWYNIPSTRVPDGGMTAMLLGGALIGVGTLRRKLTA
jgi:hypothetical protein